MKNRKQVKQKEAPPPRKGLIDLPDFSRIAEISERNILRWHSDGRLPADEPGRGRGNKHKYSDPSGIWGKALDEHYNSLPRARTEVSVYLYPEGSNSVGPLSLNDGKRIVQFIKDNEDVSKHEKFALMAILLCGDTDAMHENRPVRYMEILIQPLDIAWRSFKTFIEPIVDPYPLQRTVEPYLRSRQGRVVKSIAAINLMHLAKQFRDRKRQLGL